MDSFNWNEHAGDTGQPLHHECMHRLTIAFPPFRTQRKDCIICSGTCWCGALHAKCQVLVQTALDRESMKDAIRQCTFSDNWFRLCATPQVLPFPTNSILLFLSSPWASMHLFTALCVGWCIIGGSSCILKLWTISVVQGAYSLCSQIVQSM